MYLVDTNVISEARKGKNADAGVQMFFHEADLARATLYLSVITVGELHRGIELIRYRGDAAQTAVLEGWLEGILAEFSRNILPVDHEAARLWGHLRVPHPENEIDKLLAATAMLHGLTLVTRNVKHVQTTGVRILNPFSH
jgi:predicted nucleic acid-binding protein